MTGPKISRKRFFKIKGNELWQSLFKRNYHEGALSILILSPKGQGKSTLLATIALSNLSLGDLVLWRGRSRDYWPRFPPELTKVLHYEKDEVRVIRTPPGTNIEEDVTDRYRLEKYSSMKDLYKKLDRDTINVIYEPTYFKPSEKFGEKIKWNDWLEGMLWWYDFIFFLSERSDGRFLTLVFDEIHDIFPYGASGIVWRAIDVMQYALSETREKLIYIFGATHEYTHIDSRILGKFDGFIYLRGARVPSKITIMSDKNAAMKIKHKGVGIIEIRGRGYGGFEFDNLPRDHYLYTVKKEWKDKKPRTFRKSVREEIIEIAETEGAEKAYRVLEVMYYDGEIGKSLFYQLRKVLVHKYGLDVKRKES